MKTKNALIIISIAYMVLVMINIFTSFPLERGDNYFNIISAKGIIKYNLKPFGDFDIFYHKSDVTLNHPPLYNYILAFLSDIFKNPIALNVFGLFFILAAGIFLIKILRLIFKDISDQTIIIVYSLFLFTPLIIQASYLIDLDVVLPFIMLLFVYFYLKNPNKIFVNSLLLMLIWFAKIQGVPVIILSLFLYLFLTKKTKKDYLNTFLIVLIGSFMFFVIIFLYGSLLNVDMGKMFVHSSIVDTIKKQISDLGKTTLTSIWEIKQLVIWLIPSTVLLYFLGIIKYIKDKMLKEHDKLLLPILISIITLFELIPIGTYGWNFPKYYVVFVPFMLLSIIPVIKEIKLEKKDIYKILILFFIITLYFLLIIDPYMPEVSEAFTKKDYFQLASKVLFNFDLIMLPIIFIFIFYKGWKKERFYKILLISSMIIFMSVNIMQLTKPYSTNNLYGDSIDDLKDTINYLKTNMNSTDKALLFDHVGYYSGNSDNTNWYNSMLCYNSESCMTNIINNSEVKFMQFYPKDLERLNGKLKEIIEKNFKNDRQFGDYIIYRRK